QPRSGAHARDVQRILDPPDVRLGERGATPRQLIEVTARDRVMTRVKAVRYLHRAQDVDVGRQVVVEPPPQRLGRHAGGDVEVRDLADRVHAGVGPARSVELEVLPPCDALHGTIDLALHGLRVLLNLP